MSSDWRLHAIIGTTTLGDEAFVGTASPADADPDAPLVLPKLVSASWRHSLVEDGSWPAVQAPSTGTLTILFATAGEAAEMGAGRPVYLRLLHPSDDPTAVTTFSGRISDPELVPHRLGVMATFTMTDYLADLAEETVGEVDYPTAQQQWVRIAGLFDEAGITGPTFPFDPSDLAYSAVVGRDPEPDSLLNLAQEAVGAMLTAPFEDAPERLLFELRPNIDGFGGLDVDEPWTVVPLYRESHVTGATLNTGSIVYGGKWTRSQFSDTNTVHILSGDKVVARANNRAPGQAAVTLRRPSIALAGAATADLAAYLLPDPEWVPGWEAEALTIPLEKLTADGWPGQLRDVLTLVGIPLHHSPTGTFYWSGVITALETRIAAARVDLGLELSDRPTNGDVTFVLDGEGAEITDPDITLDGLHAGTAAWEIDPLDLGGAVS